MELKWDKTRSLTLSRILTAAALAVAAAALFCIPVAAQWYDAVSERAPIYVQLTTCLYLTDLPVLLALWELLKMLSNIAAQKIFVSGNERCLRVISWCCFAVAAVWCVLGFWRKLAFFVAFIAVFAGLIVRVVKNLVAMAVTLREENDYTI
jgi:hypothetical protein